MQRRPGTFTGGRQTWVREQQATVAVDSYPLRAAPITSLVNEVRFQTYICDSKVFRNGTDTSL